MTKMIRKHPGLSLTIIGAAMAIVLATAVVSSRATSVTETREIVLVAKGMAFHSEQQPEETNPHVKLNKGETVKLTILNEEPGQIFHCFTVPGLRLKTTRHLMEGESETILFTPKKKGVFTYTCMLHPMMTGKISVD
jgi:plastocyanin